MFSNKLNCGDLNIKNLNDKKTIKVGIIFVKHNVSHNSNNIAHTIRILTAVWHV